ncbi:MAG: Gfo/Idh/MocA family oxidoreductase [Abditibacteriales bacterium]|nr:Gfo/Idh/MocA family oxidoreductase [Abditibacteriales bacterium]MDW8366538.1 Gfo/Idh/MocA family oxidoreductase [Abditibacteriales bacterium]
MRHRVALIGLGNIARAHLCGYLSAENADRVEVVAGADISEEARQRFAEFGRTYADYRELLERERPDVVSICTWPSLHPEMVESAAAVGVKGILCEKPMAVDLGGADRMVSAARAAHAVLVVGHQRRLLPRYTRAREMIARGDIGEVVQVSAICAGDLLSDGTHAVDLLRFLTGDVPAVWVMGNVDLREIRMRYGHPVEMGAFAAIHFANGVRGTLETGMCARPGYQRLLVYGSEGQIEIGGDNPVAGEPPLRARVRGRSEWVVPSLPHVEAFAREIALLLDAVERGTPHPLDGVSARATQEILMAVFASALQHTRVDLPLDVTEHPLIAWRNGRKP